MTVLSADICADRSLWVSHKFGQRASDVSVSYQGESAQIGAHSTVQTLEAGYDFDLSSDFSLGIVLGHYLNSQRHKEVGLVVTNLTAKLATQNYLDVLTRINLKDVSFFALFGVGSHKFEFTLISDFATKTFTAKRLGLGLSFPLAHNSEFMAESIFSTSKYDKGNLTTKINYLDFLLGYTYNF